MNILIVDDHAVVREGYKALLNAMMPDCRIFDAENGAQTHRLLASSDIEILILDINLSNESGLVLAKIFLKRHPDLKIIFFSMFEALLLKSMELNQEATIWSATPINRRSLMPKPRYKTTNWKQYNKALINRGSLTFWIDEEAIARVEAKQRRQAW